MSIFGADVGELRSLGARMTNGARQIEALRGALNAQIGATQAWQGPDASRFRANWSSQLQIQLKSVGAALETAATALDRNAREQTDASAAAGGSIGGSGLAPTQTRLEDNINGATDIVGLAALGNDAINTAGLLTAAAIPTAVVAAGRYLPFIGAAAAGVTVFEDVSHGDAAATVIDGGLAIASAIPVIAVGADAMGGLLRVAVPYSSEAQASLQNYELHQRFGAGVNASNATLDQNLWLSTRYSGALGCANMISDKMSQFASTTTTPMIRAGIHTTEVAVKAGQEIVGAVGKWVGL